MTESGPVESFSAILSAIGAARVVPVLRSTSAAAATATAIRLLDEGIGCVELTTTTPDKNLVYNLQAIDPMGTDSLVADAVAIVSSIDPIMGEVDR